MHLIPAISGGSPNSRAKRTSTGVFPGPKADVAEVGAVVEDAGEEGVGRDLLGHLRCHRPQSRYLAELSLSHIGPASLSYLVAHQDDQLGPLRPAPARSDSIEA